MLVFMLNSSRVMLVAQVQLTKRISVLYAIHPHGTMGPYGKLRNGTEERLPKSMLLLYTYIEIYPNLNNIIDRNKITERWWLKSPGWSHYGCFLLRRGLLCKMSEMCVCQWCVVSNCLLIGFRGWSGETVGVDGVVGAICWAGLVGEVKGSFCELVSLVFVGCNWLVLRLWFGLCLLRGSWSGVGLV